MLISRYYFKWVVTYHERQTKSVWLNMNYNLVLLKNKSKEKGTIYCALCIDLGYKKMYLSCDSSTIAEYLNMTILQLILLTDKINVGEMLKVGSVTIEKRSN